MVIPTLSRVRIESLAQVNNSWTVIQDLEPVQRARFAFWKKLGKEEKCKGVWRRMICIFSIADLSTIVNAKSAIINKVLTQNDSVLGECIRDSVRQKEN